MSSVTTDHRSRAAGLLAKARAASMFCFLFEFDQSRRIGDFKRIVSTGQILDFDSSQPHEIAALEDQTVIINTFLYGQPEGYGDLPPHELAGKLEIELTHRIPDLRNPIPLLVH